MLDERIINIAQMPFAILGLNPVASGLEVHYSHLFPVQFNVHGCIFSSIYKKLGTTKSCISRVHLGLPSWHIPEHGVTFFAGRMSYAHLYCLHEGLVASSIRCCGFEVQGFSKARPKVPKVCDVFQI